VLLFVQYMTPRTWIAGARNPHNYLVTQPFVALLYLKTFFWPTGLNADYDLTPFATMGDARLWIGFAFAVLGPLVLTNLLWFTAIDEVGPARASIFANLQPFFAAIIALLLLDERLTAVQVAGGLAIAAGIVLSRERRPPLGPAE